MYIEQARTRRGVGMYRCGRRVCAEDDMRGGVGADGGICLRGGTSRGREGEEGRGRLVAVRGRVVLWL